MSHLQPRRNIERILADLPVGKIGTRQDAKMLCDYIGRCVTPDVRQQVWDLNVISYDPFKINGYLSNPFGLNALRQALEELGVECDFDEVEILPAANLDDAFFGKVTEPLCPLYATTQKQDEIDSAPSGTPLILLRRVETHSLIQVPNGYIGWTENQNYQPITQTEWLQLCNEQSDTQIQFLPLRQQICESAKTFLGTPYRWGGTVSGGIDCSGFVQRVYQSIGINLPRDADQQFLIGTICAFAVPPPQDRFGIPSQENPPRIINGLRSGDLLFFSGEFGGIAHVALALNENEFIHAKGGKGVLISKITEDRVQMGRYLMSKRILA